MVIQTIIIKLHLSLYVTGTSYVGLDLFKGTSQTNRELSLSGIY